MLLTFVTATGAQAFPFFGNSYGYGNSYGNRGWGNCHRHHHRHHHHRGWGW